jgi:hypothetical protein
MYEKIILCYSCWHSSKYSLGNFAAQYLHNNIFIALKMQLQTANPAVVFCWANGHA